MQYIYFHWVSKIYFYPNVHKRQHQQFLLRKMFAYFWENIALFPNLLQNFLIMACLDHRSFEFLAQALLRPLYDFVRT